MKLSERWTLFFERTFVLSALVVQPGLLHDLVFSSANMSIRLMCCPENLSEIVTFTRFYEEVYVKKKLTEIRDNLEKYPPKSQMHKAANYFLNEWDGIEAIPNYGDVDWDNNRLERVNRYISLSRHNSLFFGSHEGAKRGCIFYSLACSCRSLGINFFDYISDVMNRTAAMPPGSPAEAYRNLLLDKWIKK